MANTIVFLTGRDDSETKNNIEDSETENSDSNLIIPPITYPAALMLFSLFEARKAIRIHKKARLNFDRAYHQIKNIEVNDRFNIFMTTYKPNEPDSDFLLISSDYIGNINELYKEKYFRRKCKYLENREAYITFWIERDNIRWYVEIENYQLRNDSVIMSIKEISEIKGYIVLKAYVEAYNGVRLDLFNFVVYPNNDKPTSEGIYIYQRTHSLLEEECCILKGDRNQRYEDIISCPINKDYNPMYGPINLGDIIYLRNNNNYVKILISEITNNEISIEAITSVGSNILKNPFDFKI